MSDIYVTNRTVCDKYQTSHLSVGSGKKKEYISQNASVHLKFTKIKQ